MEIILFIAGLAFLVVGAEALVKGASRLAAAFAITPLVIGLTVVALGTSAPEIAVSINAAFSDQASLVLGNIIGSNIFNVLFILGLSALIVPLIVSQQLVRLEVPLMILLSLLVLLFSLDGRLSRIEGFILIVGLALYIWFSIYLSRRESKQVEAEYAQEFGVESGVPIHKLKNVGLVVIGLAMLVLGSRWLVESAVSFAQYLGVSELIIGLTIIAAGTSLPEVVTSVIAATRGERDIAVGNVVGSNIFNITCVLGVASIVTPTGIEVSPAVIGFDLPVMIAVAFVCLPVFFSGGNISRKEGALLLGYYVAYTLYLILAATDHDTLPRFNTVMLYFVIPLTAITLGMVVVQELRRRNLSEQDKAGG